MILSKSKYLKYCTCPKILWLEENNYQKKIITTTNIQMKYNPLKVIDQFSKELFKSCDASVYIGNKFDTKSMCQKTKQLLSNPDVKSIYKATFECDGVFFVVDILKRVKRGYIAYIVKPSKSLKRNYLIEMAYLKYILSKIDIPIYRYCIVTINKNFVKNGKIDPKKYFKVNFVGQKIAEFDNIEQNLEDCRNMLSCNQEPQIKFDNVCCSSSHQCQFWEHCQKKLPNPSIFDLHACSNKVDLYNKDILSFEDILLNKIPLNEMQNRQIEHQLKNLPTYVNKQDISNFLEKIKYPIYFLDFETMQEEIPSFDGVRPFTPIPFQYSLHYILSKNGKIQHREFLADENQDPRIELVKHLVKDIPKNSCIVAYNDTLEKNVISRLAEDFPNHKDHLVGLLKNFVDLSKPFINGYVYNRKMGGSFSIKSVLPALYPNQPDLNYINLENVQNGLDAKLIFPNLKYMEKEERERERDNLLKYCYLDTYAMVKIWQKLNKLCK